MPQQNRASVHPTNLRTARIDLERSIADGNIIEIVDRVLDKGIVFDAWVRLSIGGIGLVTVEARVVVASIETFLKHSRALRDVAPGAWALAGSGRV